MDEESYEKSLIMYVNIGEPRQIYEGKEGEGMDYSTIDGKDPEDLTEEEKIALLGRPCLGNNSRIQMRSRARMARRERRRCRAAEITSCTSSPFPGNSSLLSSRPQLLALDTPLLLS